MNNNFFKYITFKDNNLPEFGFKIHISSTIENYKKITNLLIPFLNNKRVSYKYIYKEKDVLYNYSINEDAAESGKLFTIYPENKQNFMNLLEELYSYLPKDLEGIYILSDRSYKKSNVIFYRYGTIKLNPKNTLNGLPTIWGENGEIWQDYQRTYFDLPSWVDDIQDDIVFKESYLSNKYELIDVLKYSNGGNIYKAYDNYKNIVVIKESRANILSFKKNKHIDDLENEFNILKNIDSYSPKVIEKVDEWINRYFIYEFIEGKDIYYHLIEYGLFKYKINDFQNNLKLFSKFINLIKKILDLVKYFHNKDIILNDIHTNNFRYNKNGIFFVDFGNSYIYKNKPRYSIFNDICLKEWNNIDGKIADIRKIGNLILFSIAKLHIKDNKDINSNISILNNLLKVYGIKTNLSKIINSLLTDNLDIDKAIDLFKDIRYSKDEFFYSLNYNNSIKDINFSFYNFEFNKDFIEVINEYTSKDIIKLKYLIDKENRLGIYGLSGVLLYIYKNHFLPEYEYIVDYGINSIIKKLIDYKGNKIVPIRQFTGSPYIDTGSSGFIKLLLEVNKEKYKELIVELTENLILEFAQRPGYFNGMLGIADTLIDVYLINKEVKYLSSIDSLLLKSIFYLEYKKISFDEYFFVFERYKKIKDKK